MYFSIRFDDIEYSKQEDLIETVSQALLLNWRADMKCVVGWEKEYMQQNFIKEDDWSDEGVIDEKYHWGFWLKDYAEEQAKLKIVTAFKYLEMEVEL